MADLHLLVTSDLNVPIFDAIHEGRIVLVGTKQRKRILHQGKKGAFYVKMNGVKRYLSSGGICVITNGTRKVTK